MVYRLIPIPTDNLLLGSTLGSSAVVSRIGNYLPYPGYATSNTLLNALRPYPQFSTIVVQNSPTGRTWYDSLQMKGTHRLSHGLAVNGTFTWAKSLVGIRPVLFQDSNKSLQTTDQPFLFNANISYRTPRWFSNKLLTALTMDWSLGAFLQYGSGSATDAAGRDEHQLSGHQRNVPCSGAASLSERPQLRLH